MTSNPDSFQKHTDGDIRLLPAIGLSSSGIRFENRHFKLDKEALSRVKNDDGEKYPDWLIELIHPEWKINVKNFERYDEEFFKKIGIQYREFKNSSHIEMGEEAIKHLLDQLKQKSNIDINSNNTGIIMSTGTILDSNSQLPLRSDINKANSTLERIAENTSLKALGIVNEACNGYIGGISLAAEMLNSSDELKHVVILTNDMLSRIVDFSDGNTCVLFGDQATASIVTKENHEGAKILGERKKYYREFVDDRGNPTTEAKGEDVLFNDDGKNTDGKPKIRMNGKPTFRRAVNDMSEGVIELANHLGIENIDHLLTHQANKVIVEKIIEKVKAKFPNITAPIFMKKGNVSSSSIPLLIYAILNTPKEILLEIEEELKTENIQWKDGDIIALTAWGAGIHTRSMLLKYIR